MILYLSSAIVNMTFLLPHCQAGAGLGTMAALYVTQKGLSKGIVLKEWSYKLILHSDYQIVTSQASANFLQECITDGMSIMQLWSGKIHRGPQDWMGPPAPLLQNATGQSPVQTKHQTMHCGHCTSDATWCFESSPTQKSNAWPVWLAVWLWHKRLSLKVWCLNCWQRRATRDFARSF